MNNFKLEKKLPVELNDEQLKNAAGGNELFNRVLLTLAKEDERCAQCGIAFEKGETVYLVDGNKFCNRCFAFKYKEVPI